MTKFLLLLISVFGLYAQDKDITWYGQVGWGSGSTTPGYCNAPSLFYNTGSNTGYVCLAHTYVVVGGGSTGLVLSGAFASGSGTVSIANPSSLTPASVLCIDETTGAEVSSIPTTLWSSGHPANPLVLTYTGAVNAGTCYIATSGTLPITVDANLLKAPVYCSDTSASANTVTCAPAQSFPAAYAAGQFVITKVANTNTGATTINISGRGAKAVTKNGTTALASGDLSVGATYLMVYDGTEFQVVGAIGGGGGGSGTVTVVSSGNLTSTALVTGGGSQQIQTPSATATLDNSGNLNVPGVLTVGTGTGQLTVCHTYSLTNNGTNWTVAVDGGSPATGAAIAAATSQAVTLVALTGRSKLGYGTIKSTTAWSGTGFTSFTATVGDSVGGTTFYTSSTYDLAAAVSNTNFFDFLTYKSATFAGSNITANVTANQNLSTSTITGAADFSLCIVTLP